MAKKKKTEDKFWSILKDKRDIGADFRRPYEAQWVINLAFYAGHQYSYFNSSSHALMKVKVLKGRIRKTDNQIMPKVRRQIADFIKRDPIMSVVPSTIEEEDIKSARVADKVLKAFWQNNEMKKKNRQLAGWIYTTGNAFLDDRWNPSLGPIEVDSKGIPTYLGDADCSVWSPLEILGPITPEGTTDLDSLPWMIHIFKVSKMITRIRIVFFF